MEAEIRRRELYSLLGVLPPKSQPISSKKVREVVNASYVLEEWTLDFNGVDSVPAYFVRPQNKNGPFPTIVFNHSHGGNYQLGKDELIYGNSYLEAPSYAQELTEMGYAVISIDAWGFGSRRGKTESELFKEMLWTGQVLWGKMVYDNLRVIDYLMSRPDVDSNRIGTMGMSMGSVMSWWLAALDTRLKVCVDICGLVDFHTLIEDKGLDGHGIYFYVPNLLNHFSTSEINALIAPRPHLSLAGNFDQLVPARGLDKMDEQLQAVYRTEGNPKGWKLIRYNVGHVETANMRYEIKSFIEKWL